MAHFIPMIYDCISECNCCVDEQTDEEKKYYSNNGSLLFKFHSAYAFSEDHFSIVHSARLIWHQNGFVEVSTSIPLKPGISRNTILSELSKERSEAYYDEGSHSVVYRDTFMAYTYHLRADTIKYYISHAVYGARALFDDHSWLFDFCCKIAAD